MFGWRARWLASILVVLVLNTTPYASQRQFDDFAIENPVMVRIPGHMLPALARATVVPSKPNSGSEPITLTIVLRRNDQAGFESYLHEIYNPHSKNFREFLTQRQIADRFGPRRDDYDGVISYMRARGFRILQGSKNRLTVTVRGTRSQAETAFDLRIRGYKIGARTFYANDRDPSVPIELAPRLQAVAGLSNLAKPEHGRVFLILIWVLAGVCAVVFTAAGLFVPGILTCIGAGALLSAYAACALGYFGTAAANICTLSGSSNARRPDIAVNGTGQTIGLIEFDTFQSSDVADYLNLIGSPTLISNLSNVHVNGGATPGMDQDEVLLDIDDVMGLAPGAKVVVYDGPFTGAGTSFQALFNAAIDGGSTIISNSWAYCEDQTTLADVTSIDSIFQNAAAAGISVFNGTGDSGSTCLDGSPNTISVPSDSPNATAVGGSSLTTSQGFDYVSETWWDGSANTPPTGQGGFGVSKFFASPSYQTGLGSSMRSVPDVVANADPVHGVFICQASNGGCPNQKLYGGTSSSAPSWAAFTALLNHLSGKNLGFLNPLIYPLSSTGAFHNATSMNSDFAHVGLGSPNLDYLYLELSGQSEGPASATASMVNGLISAPLALAGGQFGFPADGKTPGYVSVHLLDANGNVVSGKSIQLTASSGSSAAISPPSGVSSVNNGSVLFSVTDSKPETVTFTAEDTSDGIQLTPTTTPVLPFVTPPAAAASLIAGPSEVTADGMTPADITVALQDSLGRPTPGKLIQISQTGGDSVISGPNPPVTNASGQIEFTAVDSNNETITYSAVDVTDGNLPFPETGTVTFSDAPEPGCSNTFVAAPGYIAQPYATGFTAENFCLSGVCVSGCPGAFGLAFDSSGNLFVVDQPTGNVYKIPAGGGVANSSTLLTKTAIPSLDELAIDSKGNLYGGVNETAGNYNNGEVVTIDQSTGAISGTVASGLTCPALISIDPLSGDLFADDNCSGDGLNNASLWRISNPSGSPSVSLYTTLPGSPNGTEAFAPGGTIYVTTTGSSGGIAVVSGTNGPATPTVSTLGGFSSFGLGLIAQGSPSSSAAQFLISSFDGIDSAPGGIGTFDVTGDGLTQSGTLVTNNGQAIDMIIGPDGCVYAARGVAVFRITDSTGACTYAAANPATSLYLAPIGISPDAPQGSTQNFTTTFNHAIVPDGTPVVLNVTGANPQVVQANTTGGVASFSYTGMHEGVDTLVARATVSGSPITSNSSVVTWGAGTDVTFLTLNQSPTAGAAGQMVTLFANLTDVSETPVGALAGQEVEFSLGGTNCSAPSDSKGNASCQVTTAGAGTVTLSASFAGTDQYNPSNASEGFNVIAAVASPTPIATPTATATATTTATPTATPTPVVGKLKISPKKLNFGDVEVGSSDTREVKITNAGKVKKKHVPLPILIEMESGVTSPFSITQDCDDDDLGPKSKRVPPGSCKVAVEFAPTAAIKYKGRLIINDNLEPTPEKSVKLEGTGKEPKK